MTSEEFLQKEREILDALPNEFQSFVSAYALDHSHAYGEEVLSWERALVSDLLPIIEKYRKRLKPDQAPDRVWDHNHDTLEYLRFRISEQSAKCDEEWTALMALRQKKFDIEKTLGITPLDEDFDEFEEFMKGIAKSYPDGIAGPGFSVNRDGHCIHFMWKDVEYISEWVNHNLTLHKHRETGEVVGCVVGYPLEWEPYKNK